MLAPQLPPTESARLEALRSFEILDTAPEPRFDELTSLAAEFCATPIALLSLVDRDRQWFKASHGLEVTETPRSMAFCAHAIQDPTQLLVVTDATRDERFHDNPLVLGEPGIRFYAGVPLTTQAGLALGTLCVIDTQPRDLNPDQQAHLTRLARQAQELLESHRLERELRTAHRRVEELEAELQSLTSIASHDLRAPLRHVRACCRFLSEDLGESIPPAAIEQLELLDGSAARMDAMLDALLALSRATSTPLNNESVELQACANRAIESLRPAVLRSAAQIVLDPLPLVRGSEPLLTQAFRELVENALRFHDGGTLRIRVTAEQTDDGLVFGVRDNGIGIESRFAEAIFEPYRRLHSPREYSGIGIGLSIVRKIVLRHGGRVWVEATPGTGSHFRFTLAPERLDPQVSEPRLD